MDFELVIKSLLEEFKNENINYGLIGGFALGILGVDRMTLDPKRKAIDEFDIGKIITLYGNTMNLDKIRSYVVKLEMVSCWEDLLEKNR